MSAVPKPHLVVVDDEPQVLAALTDQLEDHFVVHAAVSGRAALCMLSELKEVSVLLSDQRMPGMTGDELFARAAEISDATQVMITGYADLEAVIRAINKGAVFGYVTKPWELEALRIMVHRAEEHHRLVRELRHERELLHNLMENSPDEIYFKGIDHRYVRVNGAAARGQGIESTWEAIGRLDAEFIPDKEWVKVVHAEDLEVAATGKPLTVDEERRRPDGTRYWVSKMKAPIRDLHGKVTGLVAIARDITERKRTEDELRRFRLAIDNSADIVLILDRKTMRHVDVNDTACRLLGYTREELLAMGPEHTLPVPRQELEKAYDGLTANPGKVGGMQSYYICKDGSHLPFESTRHVIRAGGDWLIAVISRDIRERLAAEKALRESEAGLRHAQTMSRLAHIITGPGGEFQSWSESLPALLGRERDAVPGDTRAWLALVHEDDRGAFRRATIGAGRRGERSEMKYRMRHGDGSWIHVRQTMEPLEPVREAGARVRWFNTLQDVTEQERAEQEIRLLHAVSDAMATAPSVESALRAAVQTLCEATGWDYGEAMIMYDAELGVAAQWHSEDPGLAAFAERSKRFQLKPSEGLPGEVWRTVEPAWLPDLEDAAAKTRFLRIQSARDAGLRAVLAVPATGDDGLPRAVMLLYRRQVEPGTDRVMRLASAVARQLGGAIERKQNAAQLAQREVLLKSVLDTLPVGVRVANRHGEIVMHNPAAERIWGAQADTGVQTLGWWTGSDRPVALGEWPLERAVERGEMTLSQEIDIERPDRTRCTISASGVPIREQSGAITGALMVMEDITERRAQQKRIARLTRMHATLSGINTTIVRVKSREELFREACRIAVETGKFLFCHVWLADAERRRLVLAAGAGALSSDMPDVDLDKPAPDAPLTAIRAFREDRAVVVNDLQSERSSTPLRQAAVKQGCRSIVSHPLCQGGKCIGTLSFGSADADFFDDEELMLLAELTGDVAFALETLGRSDQLYYLASHDPLTGLANRERFVELVQGQIAAPGERQTSFAVIAVNLRRFRHVNESLGRHVGDELLKQVAARLSAYAGRERVARFGTDQFCVLQPDAHGAKEATRGAERLRQALAPAYELAERQLHVAPRIGVALFPGDGADAESLCANAETALRISKTADDTVVFYKSDLNARVSEQLETEHRLRVALREGQFVLHYQPKIDGVTGRIAGAEALIRWNDPEHGLIPPGRFIPVLEETGLIVEVGSWALEEAARLYERIRARGLDCPRIAVNVSQVQMRRADFAREVIEAVTRGSEKTRGVDLEITESLLAENIDEAVRKLKALREAGFGIAVDDFGTGYSSLGYLAKLPVDTLKIDRSFVVTMTGDANSMAIVSTIINLAHSFRLKVVAEGVDSEDQLKLLRLLRCDEIQGFLFHKPLPEDQFAALLEKQK